MNKTSLIPAAIVVVTFLAMIKFRPTVMRDPKTVAALNTLSLVIFTSFVYEASWEYDSNEPHPVLQRLSKRAVGAIMLTVFTLWYMYSAVHTTTA